MNYCRRILLICSHALHFLSRIMRRVRMAIWRPLFAAHGRNFWFDPGGEYSYGNISVGDDVSLGVRPRISAPRSKIVIGSKVMFGPEVAIHGGNHTTTLLGRFMSDVGEEEKRENDDLGVTIEDDVWVGTKAIILDGVTIGRGSIVGAGAIVTKSVPPYSIVAGNPAKILRFRWDIETIIEHEEILYSPDKRYAKDILNRWQRDRVMLPSERGTSQI